MRDPVDAAVRRFEEKAKAWQLDVAAMRAKSLVNPPADTLEYAARDLLDLVRELRTDVTLVSPEDYAALHGRSPQTVRRWCAAGQLAARRVAGGDWRIARTAPPPRRRTTRAGDRTAT